MLSGWATLNGVPVGSGSILNILSAKVCMGQVNKFDPHSITVDAGDETTILAMAPYTLIELNQDYVGTIAAGYVLNPVHQITERSEHTITVELEQQALVEGSRYRTNREWVAANFLSIIAGELGSLTPGWSGEYAHLLDSEDFQCSVNIPDMTAVGAFIATAIKFSQLARQKRDINGNRLQVLQMGQFRAPSTKWISSGNGTDAEDIDPNGPVKIAGTVTYQPNDVRNLLNVCVPIGGGSSDTLVTLERCWRIVHDTTYPNWGRYGTDEESMSRTGKPSIFPSYDPNYPLTDPELGDPLLGGRTVTRSGVLTYPIYDVSSYGTYGYRSGQYADSTINYADASPANRELTSISLYISAVTNFKRFGHAHQLFTATTDGRDFPTQEGDLITIDYQDSRLNEHGTVVMTNVTEDLQVMETWRVFDGEKVPQDQITLSNLGRFDQDDSSTSQNQTQNIIALQFNKGTSMSPFMVGPFASDGDAANPVHIFLDVPAQLFLWHKCSLRIDFQGFRQTATTAVNQTQDFDIVTPPQEISLEVPDDLNLDGTFGTDGNATGKTDGFSTDLHIHVYGVNATGSSVGVGNFPQSGGANAFGRIGNAIDVPVYRNATGVAEGLDQATTSSGLVANVKKLVKKKGEIIAQIAGSTIIATLPPHTHPLDLKVAVGPLPASITVSVNGLNLDSGLTLTSGSRDPVTGALTSSSAYDEISKYVFFPGTTIDLRFDFNTSTENPTGVGRIQVSGTWFGEFGGLTSNFIAS